MKRRNIKSRLHYLIWRSDLEMTRLGLAIGSTRRAQYWG